MSVVLYMDVTWSLRGSTWYKLPRNFVVTSYVCIGWITYLLIESSECVLFRRVWSLVLCLLVVVYAGQKPEKSTLTLLGVYQSLENTQKVHNKTGPIFTYFVQFFLGYPLMWNKLVLPWLAFTVGSLLTRLTAHQLSMNIPQNPYLLQTSWSI